MKYAFYFLVTITELNVKFQNVPLNNGHKRPQQVMAPFLLNCPNANSM